MRTLIRLIVVALLGAATALLVSCGSSGKGLIPSANAGPLQNDFEEVAQAAESGNGSCSATESALGKTEQDFLALPTTIDKGLHGRLEEGIKHLRKQALEMCVEPTPTATSTTSSQTSTTPTSSGTTSTETTTVTTPTTTTPPTTQTTPTTSAPQNPGGGVEAPEEGSGEQGAGAGIGAGKESAGNGASNSGGASAGGEQ
ncbi:MAG TPA: hypothetical protein VIJ39_03365 [Solirubrobacteraceae bacterium]